MSHLFLMAGGGTGGHVFPALAVARELEARSHEVLFFGTRHGLESRLVPAAGFPIEWVEIGALQRVGLWRVARTLWQLPLGVLQVMGAIGRLRPAAVFSMGGYVAGPVALAALARRVPLVVMEPNAMPGFTNRAIGRFVSRALLSFAEAERYFPGRAEITGVPIRPEFFEIGERKLGRPVVVLITGGSRGSRTLNRAARESWELFREAPFAVRLVHQTGAGAVEIEGGFRETGLDGEVKQFIDDMPAAFAAADLVVCRSGAGAVAELAAARKPSILVPFPYAADDHQQKNAAALERGGAARLVPDGELTGERLYREVAELVSNPDRLYAMGAAAGKFSRPGAAGRAADILEELARDPRHGFQESTEGARNSAKTVIDKGPEKGNNTL